MRFAALFLLLCSCAPNHQPNPIFVADESCQAHGGTCGGNFFGGCPSEGNWRVDDSFSCGAGSDVSCCLPSDAGPDAGMSLDEAGLPADAGAALDAAGADAVGDFDAPGDVGDGGSGG